MFVGNPIFACVSGRGRSEESDGGTNCRHRRRKEAIYRELQRLSRPHRRRRTRPQPGPGRPDPRSDEPSSSVRGHSGNQGVGEMPPSGLSEEKAWQIITYLRDLTAVAFDSTSPGNVESGRQLFFGKANCANCHTIRGRGGYPGPISRISAACALSGNSANLCSTPTPKSPMVMGA